MRRRVFQEGKTGTGDASIWKAANFTTSVRQRDATRTISCSFEKNRINDEMKDFSMLCADTWPLHGSENNSTTVIRHSIPLALDVLQTHEEYNPRNSNCNGKIR